MRPAVIGHVWAKRRGVLAGRRLGQAGGGVPGRGAMSGSTRGGGGEGASGGVPPPGGRRRAAGALGHVSQDWVLGAARLGALDGKLGPGGSGSMVS